MSEIGKPKIFSGVFVSIVAVLSGCARPPNIDMADRLARTTGVSNPIELSVEGEPVDVTGVMNPVLTLEEVVSLALKHSPDLQSSLARFKAAAAEARQARLLPNPVLSIVVKFPTEGGGKPEIEAGLAADLISLLSRPGQVSAADSRLRGAAADVLNQALDVMTDVQERYVAIQTLDAELDVLEERFEIVDRLLQLGRDRLDAGEGTRLDVLTLETQRVDLEAEVAERRLEQRDQRLALATLIGEPSSGADWQLTRWVPSPQGEPREQRWVEVALEQRPEIQTQQFELAALGAELRLTGFGPFEGAEVGVEAERAEGEWSVGPGIATPIPIFDFGQARREQAQAAVIEARHELTRIRRQVVQDVRQAFAAFESSNENLRRVRERLIPLAEQRYEQAEAQFRAGQINVVELLLAEEEIRAARTRLLGLERDNTQALIRLHRAVGGAGAAITAGSSPTTVPTGASASTTSTTAPTETGN